LTESISINSNLNSRGTDIIEGYGKTSVTISEFEVKYCQELSLARDINQFYMHIGITLRYMGFSEYSFSRLSAKSEIPVPLFTMPLEMNNIYFADAHFECDPVIQYVLANDKPIFLSDIKNSIESLAYDTEITKRNKEMFALLKAYGYNDFYFIPVKASNDNGTVMLAVATKSHDLLMFRNLVKKMKSQLTALVKAIDFVGTKKFPAFFLSELEGNHYLINPERLELLQIMVRDDLKLIDAAKRLNVSRDIANRWIKSIKRRLQVDTTARAIYLAVKAGLIDEK